MLVRALLADQHPDLAALPIAFAASGWDNETFRLGDALAVRLPRHAAAAELTVREQRWLPVVAVDLPVATPIPVRHGRARERFPWPWSVVPWIAEEPVGATGLPAAEAPALVDFLEALHCPAPDGAPRNPLRGIALEARAIDFAARWARVASGLDLNRGALGRACLAARAAPPSFARVWIHGDLHPRNLLVRCGRLAGVIDWGDVCAGDPETDLASLWMLFDAAETREWTLDRLDASPALRARARSWAIVLALVFLDAAKDTADLAEVGRQTLARIAADETPSV